jgi:hypothetical protein
MTINDQFTLFLWLLKLLGLRESWSNPDFLREKVLSVLRNMEMNGRKIEKG